MPCAYSILCVSIRGGNQHPSCRLLNTFSDTHKGLWKGPNPTISHLCQKVIIWTWAQISKNPFLGTFKCGHSIKPRALFLGFLRIFNLASNVGVPVLGHRQAPGTWERSIHTSSQGWRHSGKYLELKPVSKAHLKWTRFHFYKSQNNVQKHILICLMPLKDLLEKLHHLREGSFGCPLFYLQSSLPLHVV